MDLRLHVTHLPGIENSFADALSRMQAAGDYALKPNIFEQAIRRLQVQPSIDLFAAAHNHKLPRFAALPPGGSQTPTVWDAFTFPWTSEIPFAFPPINIIPRVLQKMHTDRVALAVLVVPEWPSRPWWNLITTSEIGRTSLGLLSEVLTPGPTMTDEDKLPPGSLLMVKLSFA